MSEQAVGDDLFSLIRRFATPRQAAVPEPPQQGPPQPPQQGPTPAGPPVAPPPQFPPEEVPTGSVTPPQPVSTRTLSTAPAPTGADLTQQFLDIQKKQAKEAALAALPGSLSHAAMSMGAMLTRSPSARESLTSMANAHAAQPQSGVGNLTAESFLNFHKQAETLQGRARFTAALPELSKRTGMTPTQLQAMYDADPKSVSNLLETIGKEGTEKSRLELGLKGRETEIKESELGIKTSQEKREVTKFSNEEKVRLSSDAAIPELSRITGQPVEVIQGLDQKQRASLLEQQVKPQEQTAEQKTLNQINRERQAAKLPTYTMEEYKDLEGKRTENLKRIDAGFGAQAGAVIDANKEADKANQSIVETYIARNASRANLLSKDGIIGGSAFSPANMAVRKLYAAVTGDPDPKVYRTEAFTAGLANDILATMKTGLGGAQLSDNDLRFAREASGGNIEMSQESVRRLMAIRDRLDRAKLQANNEGIDRRYNALPGLAKIVEPKALPAMDKENLRYTDNAELTQALSDPKQLQRFETLHGRGSLDEHQNRIDEVIQSKMATMAQNKTYSAEDSDTFKRLKGKDAAWMEQNRAALEAGFKQYGDMGNGLFDLILAAKKAGKF
jgi:hypothetical protein